MANAPLIDTRQLAEELKNVGYLRDITGTGGGGGAASTIPLMAPDQLQLLMTQFARNSNLTNILDMSRQSGLYNSNTQKLLGNDVMAQAAMKAAMANVEIAQGNAKIQQANAANKLGTNDKKRKQQDLVLAALLAGSQGKNFGAVGSAVGKGYDAISQYFAGNNSDNFSSGQNYTPSELNNSELNSQMGESGPEFNFGSLDYDVSQTGFDLGGGEAFDTSSMPDLTDTDWEDLIGSGSDSASEFSW